MTKNKFYVDSCIWINFFKEEGDETKGEPYWSIANKFFQFAEEHNYTLIISTIVLKELTHKLKDDFNSKKEFFEQRKCVRYIKTKPQDYDLARKFELKDNFNIGFYDYLHVAISKRLNLILITRDKNLIKFAKDKIQVNKPEDLIS